MRDNFLTFFSSNNLPLYCGLETANEVKNCGLPRFFPFEWGINMKTGLFSQKQSEELIRTLTRVYDESSLTVAPPAEGDFSEKRTNAVLDAVLKVVGEIKGKRILEIGCSNGFIMKKLQDLGAVCCGVEPGIQGKIAKEKFGLDVKVCYFEQADLEGQFDLVYSVNVLEHVFDPECVIAKALNHTKRGGVFLAGVPNSPLEMSIGSPNMFLHEHLWYYTPECLYFLLEKCGLEDVHSFPFSYGAIFFASGVYTGKRKCNILPADDYLRRRIKETHDYIKKVQLILNSMQRRIDEMLNHDRDIALYGASNVRNYLGLLNWTIPPKVFDTDTANHGKYLWSKDHIICVESPDSLYKKSPSEIWILPVAHQTTIRDFLLARGISPEKIVMLSDFLIPQR